MNNATGNSIHGGKGKGKFIALKIMNPTLEGSK
jgi:hypothetical protein